MHGIFVCIIFAYGIADAYLLWRHRHILPDEVIAQLTGKSQLSSENYTWVYANEYLPVQAAKIDITTLRTDETKLTSLYPVQVEILKWHSAEREMLVITYEQNVINLQTFWFPGWQILINDKEASFNIKPDDGTVEVSLPKGKSVLKLRFERSPTRLLAFAISITGLLVTFMIGLVSILRKQAVTNENV